MLFGVFLLFLVINLISSYHIQNGITYNGMVFCNGGIATAFNIEPSAHDKNLFLIKLQKSELTETTCTLNFNPDTKYTTTIHDFYIFLQIRKDSEDLTEDNLIEGIVKATYGGKEVFNGGFRKSDLMEKIFIVSDLFSYNGEDLSIEIKYTGGTGKTNMFLSLQILESEKCPFGFKQYAHLKSCIFVTAYSKTISTEYKKIAGSPGELGILCGRMSSPKLSISSTQLISQNPPLNFYPTPWENFEKIFGPTSMDLFYKDIYNDFRTLMLNLNGVNTLSLPKNPPLCHFHFRKQGFKFFTFLNVYDAYTSGRLHYLSNYFVSKEPTLNYSSPFVLRVANTANVGEMIEEYDFTFKHGNYVFEKISGSTYKRFLHPSNNLYFLRNINLNTDPVYLDMVLKTKPGVEYGIAEFLYDPGEYKCSKNTFNVEYGWCFFILLIPINNKNTVYDYSSENMKQQCNMHSVRNYPAQQYFFTRIEKYNELLENYKMNGSFVFPDVDYASKKGCLVFTKGKATFNSEKIEPCNKNITHFVCSYLDVYILRHRSHVFEHSFPLHQRIKEGLYSFGVPYSVYLKNGNETDVIFRLSPLYDGFYQKKNRFLFSIQKETLDFEEPNDFIDIKIVFYIDGISVERSVENVGFERRLFFFTDSHIFNDKYTLTFKIIQRISVDKKNTNITIFNFGEDECPFLFFKVGGSCLFASSTGFSRNAKMIQNVLLKTSEMESYCNSYSIPNNSCKDPHVLEEGVNVRLKVVTEAEISSCFIKRITNFFHKGSNYLYGIDGNEVVMKVGQGLDARLKVFDTLTGEQKELENKKYPVICEMIINSTEQILESEC